MHKRRRNAWFIETKSETAVQRKFRTWYNRSPPSRPTIRAWYEKFMATGSVEHKKGYGRPRTSDENVERVRQSFLRSPQKSVRTAARELQMSRSTVHDVVRKRLKMYPYKLQIVQAITQDDRVARKEFAVTMLRRMEQYSNFLEQIIFSDESTFHVSGKVNKHNVRIWGSENPHVTGEYVRDSPKVNVWCGVPHERVIGPFFSMSQPLPPTFTSTCLKTLPIHR